MSSQKDQYKEKFRPDTDSALERELSAALGEVSIEKLYGFDKPQPKPDEGAEQLAAKGLRKGRVVSIGKDDVFIDLGGKSQGIISLTQFDEVPTVGQELEFHVERYDPREGLLILTRRGGIATNVSWDNLEIGQIVEGTVTGMNKGGLELQVKNMRAFMPAGQVDVVFHKDISIFIGQRLTAEVTQFDREKKNLIVSRRNIVEREKEEARQKMLSELTEGQVRRGSVTSVMDYGAFVEAEEGLEGLLPVSEISWQRIKHPADVLKEGDTVKVVVIALDPVQRRMTFSIKQAGGDPWAGAADRFPQDAVVSGKVTRVADFGAFVELEPGLEGLVHVSELAAHRVRTPADVVKPGDEVRVRVLELDKDKRRIALSIRRAAEAMPAATAASAAAPDTAKKKKRPQLRGGLDF